MTSLQHTRSILALRERFGDQFVRNAEMQEGDRFLIVEDSGEFFAAAAARSRQEAFELMSEAANDREQPSNIVGYIDLEDPGLVDGGELKLVIVAFVVRAGDTGYDVSILAADDEIRDTIERSL